MSAPRRPLIPIEKFPPQLHKFLAAESPLPASKLVVQGLIPMDGAIKICGLYQVAHLHPELYAPAGKALRDSLEIEQASILTQLPPPILDWVGEVCSDQGEVAANLLAHPQTAKSTLMRLLTSASPQVANRLAVNQTKLLSDPMLFQSLCLNPNLDPIIQRQLLELAKYQGSDLSWFEIHQKVAHVDQVKSPSSSPLSTTEVASITHSLTSEATSGSASDANEVANHQTRELPSASNDVAKDPFSLVGDQARQPEPERLSHTPLSEETFPEQVRKFVSPTSPDAALNLIYGGLFPMTPELRVCALYQIAHTRQAQEAKAIGVIRSLEASVLTNLFRVLDQSIVLDWLADVILGAEKSPIFEAIPEHPDLITSLSQNPMVASETLVRVALFTSDRGCERLANNQRRLVQTPEIIPALYYNPKFSTTQADRVLEFAAREGLDLSWLPVASEVLNELAGEVNSSGVVDDSALQRALVEGAEVNPADAIMNAVLEAHAARKAQETGEEEPKKKGYALIQSLNVAQKIRLALLGSQSDRALLVKDANKVVSRAAIRSPAVSVSEALVHARNHSLNADIIEFIATNRKWMQNYRVKVQIVLNPKTPVNIALNALGSLRPAELRQVAQSHGVSGVVSARAKAMIKQRQG